MEDTTGHLDKSIQQQQQQPLQLGPGPELSPCLTLLGAEHHQDSSSDPPPPSLASPPTVHPSSLGPCSPPIVDDDASPPSAAMVHEDMAVTASNPTPSLVPPADMSQPSPSPSSPPPPLSHPSPSNQHPPSPSTLESPLAPPAQHPSDPSVSTVETVIPAEPQAPSPASPQPQPTDTASSPPAALPAPAITDPVTITAPTAVSSSPVAAVLQKELLPTPPVSDCSPTQLDSIHSQPPPPHSPPPSAPLPLLHQTTLPSHHPTTVSSTLEAASPLPRPSPIASSPLQSAPAEQPSPIPPPPSVGRQTPPPQPLSNSASVNSLSPLSDVPSAHSPRHVMESPSTHPRTVLSPRPSPVVVKRQAPPPMLDKGTAHSQTTDASSARPVNGNSLHPNGQSAHKRPRLADDSSSSNPPPSLPSTTPFHPQQPVSSHPTTAKVISQPMGDAPPLVPGHPGTRLTKDQHRFAISVTKQLKKHRSSGPFLQPVDPVKLNIPDYFNVVTHPMDLSTIETRLGKVGKPCHYRSVQDFVSDVTQVFTNCYLYNGAPHASLYSRMAADLSIQFEAQMKKMPPEEPISFNPSPTIAKPQPKAKPSTEPRISPPAPKRKNASPMATTSSLPAPQMATGQKRRSTSPQHPRKKVSKATSQPVSVLPDGNSGNSEIPWRASINDPSSSQRAKVDSRDQSHSTGNHYGQPAVEPLTIPNSKAELKFCKDVLREVNKKAYEKFVWPFYEPVDIVKLGIPDYPKYVKRPMDLETMKNKLAHGEYPNGAAFAEDFRLMLKNCYAFNPPTSAYYHCGKQLESLFEAKWAERPPAEILAPMSMPTAAVVAPPALDPIQVLQMQVAELQERLDVETSKKVRTNSTHVIPGTGPPKKQSYARAPALSKSLSNPSIPGPLPPGPAAVSAPKIAKGNSTGPVKPKQAHGGARRKSAGSALAPSAKLQPQPYEQPLVDRQPDNPEHILPSYPTAPLASAALVPESVTVPSPVINRRLSEPDYFEKIDYEQKKDLATQIQNAVEPMQSDAINLIRTSRPDLVPADGEEIELDIDALDDRTLYQLYQLVCAPPPPPPPPKGKKGTKGGATNGKPKGAPRRKAGPGTARKSSTTSVPLYAPAAAQAPGFVQEDEAPDAWPPPGPQVANGNGNGTKPKAIKKPRSSATAPRRKGIDETQEAARIKELEEKLHEFEGYTDPQPHYQNHHSNGVSSTNPALGAALNEPPPAGPVEYASSSSESESESDDDSD